MREEYRVDEHVPDRDNIIEALDRIMTAKDAYEAEAFKKKALDKMQMFCLGAWARKEAKGPVVPETPMSLESDAKAMERFADLDDSKGKHESADKKREQAAEIRKRAAKLRTRQEER
jgi:hypothetical protein